MKPRRLLASLVAASIAISTAAHGASDGQYVTTYLSNYGIATRLVGHTFTFRNTLLAPPFDHGIAYLSADGLFLLKRRLSDSEVGPGGIALRYRIERNRLCLELKQGNLCGWLGDGGENRYHFITTLHGVPQDSAAIASVAQGDPLKMAPDRAKSKEDARKAALFNAFVTNIIVMAGPELIKGTLSGNDYDDDSSPQANDCVDSHGIDQCSLNDKSLRQLNRDREERRQAQ